MSIVDLRSESIAYSVSYALEEQGWQEAKTPAWACIHPDGKLLVIGSGTKPNALIVVNLVTGKQMVELESDLVLYP